MTTPMREKMIAQVEAMREKLRGGDPREYAVRTGGELADGGLRMAFFREAYTIAFPDLEVRREADRFVCGLNRTAMFLYYLLNADGSPLEGKWVAFRDLPSGMFYHQAYQGYSGDRLAKAIDNRISVFERAAKQLGGEKLQLGDAAFAFTALPRVRVAAVYYAGDEDFPASANVLFDASIIHYLPTDVCAGVGSTLVDRLIGAETKDDSSDG
ncbi:MAG: DUF3786 domain-containing protein [Chloroflexi bacterium]|nr:DUF3786 domain-containing protein [Chloroflexota bacterium]